MKIFVKVVCMGGIIAGILYLLIMSNESATGDKMKVVLSMLTFVINYWIADHWD